MAKRKRKDKRNKTVTTQAHTYGRLSFTGLFGNICAVGGLTPNLDRFMVDPIGIMKRHGLANKPPDKPINQKKPAHRVSLKCQKCHIKLRRAWAFDKPCHQCGGPVWFTSYEQLSKHERFVSSVRGASAIGRGSSVTDDNA